MGYRLYDINGSACSISVEYSTDGGASWEPATAAPGGGEGTSGLSSAVTGAAHTIVWDALVDLGFGTHSPVRVRITPSDPAAGGSHATADFAVRNPRGDFDFDGDGDLRDFGRFQECFGASATGACASADFTDDGLVTLDDYVPFITGFTGP